MSATAIEFSAVSKRYGDKSMVDGVSFAVPALLNFACLPNKAAALMSQRFSGALSVNASNCSAAWQRNYPAWRQLAVASSIMMPASFEATCSGFSRMHVQCTWEAIIAAPAFFAGAALLRRRIVR